MDAYIAKYHGVDEVASLPLDQDTIDEATTIVAQRRADRAAALAAQGQAEGAEVKSEA